MRSTATLRPILHADWPGRLGQNRPDESSQTFGGYDGNYRILTNEETHTEINRK